MAGPSPEKILTELAKALDGVQCKDRPALHRRLSGLRRRVSRGQPIDRGLPVLIRDIETSVVAVETRKSQVLATGSDPSLPIAAHRDAIVEAIRHHPVVVVAGETGSGKTTQLPKMCVEAGRGERGLIGCTQPRRLAARAIAARLAEEMSVPMGAAVGYQVRFDDRTGADTRIKVMTDGILLAETVTDRDLLAYDTLIIDEAHERSLNIDFLLGYLRRLLERRPDLRVIITSATIDTERFSRHFGGAPVVEVSGRNYPVEMRYRPLADDEGEDRDLPQGIVDAVGELSRVDPMGDILVFLPGERDIREAQEALTRRRLKHTEILPLFARLSNQEQNRIFHPSKSRRIVLATNVAETSLTVPRIRFVIDSGLARISRYSHRSKVQRLPIEAVSQASANQRAGRCGRLGPGICVRLYAEDDFELRPEYTEPEIVRTNLASVILQMETLGLGQIEDFPFIDHPDDRLVRDGYHLLFELGALDDARRMTETGREMARWPLDVRLARLVLAARDRRCLAEGLILAAGLSVQDPRERPLEAQQAADEAHARWQDPKSDFRAQINLWQEWTERRGALGGSALRRWCRDHFLSWVRMREWSDIRRQLEEQARESGWKVNAEPADDEAVHRAVLAGYLGQIGMKEEKGYVGARQHRFQIFPGSGLFKSQPPWLVTAFLMETGQVYARVNARIEPEWAEQAAAHLVRRHTFDPYWSKRGGRVMAYQQVTLYGIPLVLRRRVGFGPIDPAGARRIFIREGLVKGQIQLDAPFLEHNARQVAEVEDLEHRQRRRDLLVDEDALVAFFEARIPEHVCDLKGFQRWRRKAEAESPELLFYRPEQLLAKSDHGVHEDDYPRQLTISGLDLPLSYRLDPGSEVDGVTVTVPLSRLNAIDPGQLEWLVPGLLHEKVTALIKTLPKVQRRQFVPAPDVAREFVAEHPHPLGSLLRTLARWLTRRSSIEVNEDDFDADSLADHLRANIALDDGESVVDQGRDLEKLRARHAEAAREEFLAQAGVHYHADNLREWDFGDLPESLTLDDGAEAWPAVVDQEDAAGLRLFETPEEALEYHRFGVRRLLELALKDRFRYLRRQPPVSAEAVLQYAPVDTADALREDLVQAVSLSLIDEVSPPVRSTRSFEALCREARAHLLDRANRLGGLLDEILGPFHRIRMSLSGDLPETFPEAAADIESQLGWLIYPGFLVDVSEARLRHYPRYLAAVEARIERLDHDPGSDRQRQDRLQQFWDDCQSRYQHFGLDPALDDFHWMLEEYRVSLFAQSLKTARPVSSKRLRKAWQAIVDAD